ncbi:MAG: hypothetical protein EOP54_06780 [Sphingobacteriales bacterium]|nr:MAG: hypothetical protein EOP54_06780 [Sphingobacteriales bacterium]
MNKVYTLRFLFHFILLQLFTVAGYSQPANFSVSLATVDAGMLNKKSLFDFQVTSTSATVKNVMLKGTVKYRNQPYKVAYTLKFLAQPGVNNIAEYAHRAVFEYSSSSVKELFELFDRLPEGTLQYCVTLGSVDGESTFAGVEDCTFGKHEDLFLINLIDPENKAELYELNPMLSWVANYPFASSLAYKIKVVEMKQDQNVINAIKRNNPVYEEKGLMQLSINYPIYAKPLQVGSTYAWTVDAYYKDLLLGGAEPWQFTIIEDSILAINPQDISFYEFEKHQAETQIYAVDSLKLKYESFHEQDTIQIEYLSAEGKSLLKMPYPCMPGTNMMALDLRASDKFKHAKVYRAIIRLANGKTFTVPFKFIKSEFIK